MKRGMTPKKRATHKLLSNGKPSTNGGAPLPTDLLTVVGEQARIEGKFDIAGSIQVECQVGGEMRVGRKLIVVEKGTVHADVRTVDAVIRGEYKGNMVATGNVEIATTGRVSGNVECHSIVIAKGGTLNGNVIRMSQSDGHRDERTVYVMPESQRDQRPVFLLEESRLGQAV